MSQLRAVISQPSERKRLTSGMNTCNEGSGSNYLLAAVEGLDDSMASRATGDLHNPLNALLNALVKRLQFGCGTSASNKRPPILASE